jgi:hypothetical protein
MPPVSFVFDRLMEEVERRVSQAISRDEIEADPIKGPAIVGKAVDEVVGDATTREMLVIMSSIENIDEYGMNTRYLDETDEVSDVIKRCFNAIIGTRLTALRDSVAVLSFAAGFPAVAEKLVSLAELAVETFPNSKWVSGAVVVETRDALERVLDRNGSESDLQTVLRATELLRGLMMSPKDKVGWRRHGLDHADVAAATADFKPYKDMLGLGWSLANEALIAISNRADSELRPASSQKEVAPAL